MRYVPWRIVIGESRNNNDHNDKKSMFQLKQVPQKKKRRADSKKVHKVKEKQQETMDQWETVESQRGVEKYGPKFDLIYNDPEFGLGSFSRKSSEGCVLHHVYQGGGKNKRKNVIHENTNGKNEEGDLKTVERETIPIPKKSRWFYRPYLSYWRSIRVITTCARFIKWNGLTRLASRSRPTNERG